MWHETEYAVAAEPAQLAGGLGSVLVVAKDTSAAVLNCAGLLDGNPGSLVVAVCLHPPRPAGRGPDAQPIAYVPQTQEAGAAEEEGLLALFLLDASPVTLSVADAPSQTVSARLRDRLGEQLGRHCPDSVVFALGAGDAADRLVAESCLRLCADTRERRWIMYADAADAAVVARVDALRARGFCLEPLEAPQADSRKAHALACFTGPRGDALQAGRRGRERYWQVGRIG